MQSGYNLFWSKRADDDLDDIIKYLETHFSDLEISNFFKILEDQLIRVKENPDSFVKHSKNIRKILITKQTTLYFIVKKKQITIIRLFDQRQDPNKLGF